MTTITGPNISGNIAVIGEPFNMWSVNIAPSIAPPPPGYQEEVWPESIRGYVLQALNTIECRVKCWHALDHKVQEILDDLRREVRG